MQNEKRVNEIASEHGLMDPIKNMFKQYLDSRGFNTSHDDYIKTWAKRFQDGSEWIYSDYTGRGILKEIASDIYPDDINAVFARK